MYPEQIPAEVVIENSTLANKEVIAGQIDSAQSVQRSAVSPSTKLRTGGQNPSSSRTTTRQGKTKMKVSRDFVNTLTTTGKRREDLMV